VRHVLLALALAASTSAARAESPAPVETPHYAWELDLYGGYGQLAFPGIDSSNLAWYNGGPSFALSVAYRGEHFTHPFIDISYVPILASGQYVNVLAPGGSQTIFANNSSYALGLAIGPGWDIDWFRIRVGLGLYDVVVKTGVSGSTNTVSQLSLGFMASLSAMVWRPEPFALGIEGRMVGLNFPMTGVYQTMWSAGITGRWDFVHH
jgi:opacity protein-like surface antigen